MKKSVQTNVERNIFLLPEKLLKNMKMHQLTQNLHRKKIIPLIKKCDANFEILISDLKSARKT